MTAYYNEHDPKAAAWLRELIAQGQVAPGDVDERSIEDVLPTDLVGYTQHHFFAGIGGWSYALRLAGWPDDEPVWTASCPCQPFSAAGKRSGANDERHLWPAFRWLAQQLGPATIFGEQVESPDGRQWLAGVRLDLEAMGYTCGAADLCAAGAGAPQIRQRLYWVANTGCDRWPWRRIGKSDPKRSPWNSSCGTHSRCSSVMQDGLGRKYRGPCGHQRLADGISARMDVLRGYGNAIVPQIAAEFIQAYCEAQVATNN